MKKTKVRLTFSEELLGTASANPEIHSDFIASRAPSAESSAEEILSITAGDDSEEAIAAAIAEAVEKSRTIFSRDADGHPHLWDYQVKGFFKDACGMLARAAGTESSKITAYKKIIDGLVFVNPRQIPLVLPEGGEVGYCQRPLRAQTAKGERIALAHSETVPAGTFIEIEIEFMELAKKEEKKSKAKVADVMPTATTEDKKKARQKSVTLAECVEEWLAYGALRGLGQWRNSGKGRFRVETLD